MTCLLLPGRHKACPLAAAVLVLAAAALALPGAAGAAFAALNSGYVTDPNATIGVPQLEAAADLAALGRANRDPLLLVAAARVVIASGVTPGPGPEPESKVGAKPTDAATTATRIQPATLPGPTGGSATDSPWSAEALLAEAATMAADNTTLKGIIRETEASSGRGVVIGPSQTHQIIMPGQVQRFRFTFAARERADASLRVKPGPLGAQLTLEALDDRKRRVTATGSGVNGTARLDHALYIAWQPDRCGEFMLVVKNTGTAPAAYALTTAPSDSGTGACLATMKSGTTSNWKTGARK